jgi:hypothetical protein
MGLDGNQLIVRWGSPVSATLGRTHGARKLVSFESPTDSEDFETRGVRQVLRLRELGLSDGE